jgi:N6-adenosine-specific RNA methylase IME4
VAGFPQPACHFVNGGPRGSNEVNEVGAVNAPGGHVGGDGTGVVTPRFPLLAESFDVVRAWGFSYKTAVVWDKVVHHFGHYVSSRCELLLICTRGSCQPDVRTLIDNVVSIEKSAVHSEKPERFREIIDELYPHGPRIELFARQRHEGWDVWGNEVESTRRAVAHDGH